jgi:putative hemolysin
MSEGEWERQWNKFGPRALIGMPQKLDNADPVANARAQALLKRRQEQQIDAPKAMAEYRAAEQAKYTRMQELRTLRLAREAQMRRDQGRGVQERRDQARTPVRGG